jgi:hypothetical protein
LLPLMSASLRASFFGTVTASDASSCRQGIGGAGLPIELERFLTGYPLQGRSGSKYGPAPRWTSETIDGRSDVNCFAYKNECATACFQEWIGFQCKYSALFSLGSFAVFTVVSLGTSQWHMYLDGLTLIQIHIVDR